jgi:hypothetical protein
MRHRRRAGHMPHHVDEAAGPRVAAEGHAQRGVARVLPRAAGHLHGLLHLVVVVEVERRERQHQRMHRAGRRGRRCGRRRGGPRRIQQRQLTRGMAQLCRHLPHGLGEALAIAAVTELLLVLQHRQRDGDGGHGQQQEHAAEEQPQAEKCEAGPAPRGEAPAPGHGFVASHLKPRIGTLSMPSNVGSISRNASRIVLMCLRTLSRLRPVLTTWNRSS